MTLQQKIADLIGHWDGLDATERSNHRQQLVADLLNLIQAEQPASVAQPEGAAPAAPAAKSAA